MKCITYNDQGFCGLPADLSHDGLWLCENHALAIEIGRKKTKALAAIKSTDKTGIYILRTPYDTLKIGASINLSRRLRDLHRAFRLDPTQRLELLAWDPDCTYLTESVLHNMFWDFLLTDRSGEQFEDVPEIRDQAVSIGLHSSFAAALAEYDRTEFSGSANHKMRYLPPTLRNNEMETAQREDPRLYLWQLSATTGMERHTLIAWLNENDFEINTIHGESMSKAWISKTDFQNYLLFS